MNKGKKLLKTRWRTLGVAMSLSACLASYTACDTYDLDEFTPAGWGASIYSYLEDDGNFSNTLRLIDDLGYKEVLAKTGSKTLFAADDDAFNRFYAKNEWRVTKYEELSLSQKKMLLLGNMINSSYQVHDLASIEGPIEGQSIRRASSMSVFDTVSIVKPSDLPYMEPGDEKINPTWQKFRGRDNIVLMRDMSVTPMVYFVEAALANNKITNADYAFLVNDATEREAGDASVNGVKIAEQNIKCSNGFIHKMADVMVPLKNMAEVISDEPKASLYNSLLQRFSAPYYPGDPVRDQYRYLYDTDVDSIFEVRFFSEKSNGGSFTKDDDNVEHHDLLRFDPEWNSYYCDPIPSASVAVEKDMAVMLVPTDSALNDYFDYKEGRVLKAQYKSWDKVPNDVIIELLNNNQLYSFISSVPSKFGNILNDANDPMGLSKGAIEKVKLACNGAVYFTKEVYPPTSYVSVLFPAIINTNMKLMRWAVEQNNYKVYLNSLNSRFSFFIPTNDALLTYVDPVSYAAAPEKAVMYKFHYDASRNNPVWASRFFYDMTNGVVGDSIDEVTNVDVLKSKLKEVLDNHIVIGDVEDGNTFYRTKGGQEIMVENVAAGKDGMKVSGSLAYGEGTSGVSVVNVYNQTDHGNGKSYILSQPIMTTRKTVLDVLAEHPEMSMFRELLEVSSLVSENDDKRKYVGKNMSVFNTYHYTVYVPTNEAIQTLIASGELPTWDDVQKAKQDEDKAREEMLTKKIEDFLKLHIQDYSLFIGAKPLAEEGYETALINEKTEKFERLYTTLTKDGISIKNTLDTKSANYMQANVVKKEGLYNLMAREYQLNAVDYDVNKKDLLLWTSSTAVIHLIDKPLKLAK